MQGSDKPRFFKKGPIHGFFGFYWLGFGLYWVFGFLYLNEQLGSLLADLAQLSFYLAS